MKLSAAANEIAKQGTLHSFAATYIGEKKINSRFKAVVGIDLGTTYSGVSIIASDNTDKIMCGAPGATNARDETKEPTVLLKLADDTWLFGNKALQQYNELVEEAQNEIASIYSDESVQDYLRRNGISLFRHFKMQLKNKTEGYDSLMAKSTFGDEHSLMSLMTKVLSFLSEFALKEIQNGWLGAAYGMSAKDIMWVVTVPAIWNDFGKSFMRKAAHRAGLIQTETADQLLLALEPESAAVAVHGEGASYSLFQEGSSFLVLDIGGGTVDVTLHNVASVSPLVLNEISDPVGGPWGGIFVDAQFKLFLKQLFGTVVFESIQRYYPVDITEIMDEFRTKKENFKPDDKKQVKISLAGLYTDESGGICELPRLSELVKKYNETAKAGCQFDISSKRTKDRMDRTFTLSLPKELMKSFFDPTLESICGLVRQLLDQHQDVGTLVVVGGYGSSAVVAERIRSVFGPHGLYGKNVIVPDGSMSPQAAVVQGAAYFGLNTRVIGNRVARYTLGVSSSTRWHEGCGFPRSEAEWDEERQEMRVKDVFSILIRKGDKISPFQEFVSRGFSPVYDTQQMVSFPVYRSSAYSPKRTTEDTCEKQGKISIPCRGREDEIDVFFTFGTELEVEVVRRNDNERRKTIIEMDP